MKSKKKKCILRSTFLNRDLSLDKVRKCIKVLTSVLEGRVSHFFEAFNIFLWNVEKMSHYFLHFFTFHIIQN